MSASRLRPSSRWCADWQAWVQHNVNAAPSRFNAVGAQAEACEERLTLHASIADSINEWTATSRVSLLFKRVSGSSDAGVITAAGEHASLVAGLAATQIDRQALSLRSNTRKSHDALGAARIVQDHRAALELLFRELDSGAPLSVELLVRVHRTLLGDAPHAGVLRTSTPARVGSIEFAPAEQVHALMHGHVAAVIALCSRPDITHLGLAAAAAHGLLSIHPFHDGNGRMSRLVANAMLRMRGVPFVINVCATEEHRAGYVGAIIASREGSGSVAPFATLLADHLSRVWEELDRLGERARAQRDEAASAETLRKHRERARKDPCMICLEEHCNMLTLCCGAACHINCMAQWLSEAASPTCCNCREELPRPQPRPAPPPPAAPAAAPAAAEEDDTTTIADDDDTTLFSTDDTQVVDDATTISARIDRFVQAAAQAAAATAQASAASANDTTISTDDTTTQAMQLSNDTTTDDTTALPQPRYDARGRPVCVYCSNQPAPSCANSSCGRCCVLHAPFACARHNTT